MLNSQKIAAYFLHRASLEGRGISNLKIQKLLYYAQGLYLGLTDTKLFSDKIEAWDFGPVAVDAYHCYKSCGSENIPIPARFEPEVFNEIQTEVLDVVYKTFGHLSPYQLVIITHNEPPWKAHEISENRADGKEITKNELCSYFKKFVPNENYFEEFVLFANDLIKDQVATTELPEKIVSEEDFVNWARSG